jgi:hypothetical protein
MDNLNPEYNKIEMFSTLERTDDSEVKILWHTWELSLTTQTVIALIVLMLAVRIIFL